MLLGTIPILPFALMLHEFTPWPAHGPIYIYKPSYRFTLDAWHGTQCLASYDSTFYDKQCRCMHYYQAHVQMFLPQPVHLSLTFLLACLALSKLSCFSVAKTGALECTQCHIGQMMQPIFLFYFCNWSETMRLSWHWCVLKVLARLCNKVGAELDRTTISWTKQCTRNLDPRWANGFVGTYICHIWKSASCTMYHYVIFVFSCRSRNSRTLPYFDVETGFIKREWKYPISTGSH